MISLILGIGFLLSTSALIVSLRRNLEFMERIDDIESALQRSVAIIEEQYGIIDQKTKIEVFSDEPVVKNLVQDIAIARNAVLDVAKMLDDTISNETSGMFDEIEEKQ